MTPELALELVRRAVSLTLIVAGPLLVTGLVVGIVVGLLQALTQIQEQTLTFIPKATAVAIVLLALFPWMLRQMLEYLVGVLQSLPSLAG
jgi:flagellar biosynthetic protein FliQ